MAQMMTSTIPMTQAGMPKAVWKVEPMELDCTMLPMRAQGQDDGNGEEPGQELAEAALESGGDVVHGAAVNGAVLVNDTGSSGPGWPPRR